MLKRIAAAALALCAAQTAHAGCLEAAEPCEIASGDYHIALPDGVENPPAIIFLHGAGGTGKGITRNKGALNRGYALIGPNGLDREGSRFGTGWYFHPSREKKRDEIAFVREVIADAAEQHGIDPDRVLLGGFSIGGSMASYIACDDPTIAKGFAPVAGSFWRPHPEMESCAGPVNLLHTHGWRDKTVPLEGRPLGGGRIYQGDVFYAMQVWRETNKCAGMRADKFNTEGNFWRRKWDTCENGALEFALHQGAHGIPKGWAEMAIDWFETLE